MGQTSFETPASEAPQDEVSGWIGTTSGVTIARKIRCKPLKTQNPRPSVSHAEAKKAFRDVTPKVGFLTPPSS